MLPGRGLIARIRGKGDAYGAILAIWALGPPQCKEGMRGFMGAARWVAAGGGAGASSTAGSGVGRTGAAGAAVVGAAVRGHGGAGTRRWWVLRAGGVRRW